MGFFDLGMDKFNKGCEFYNKGNFSEAAYWFRKSADCNNAGGQSWLGSMYRDGQGVTQDYTQDYTQAVVWYRKAADQGDAFDQWSLGTMYRDGRGVTQDEATSLQYFAKAAETFLNMEGRGMYSKYWYGFMLENGTILILILQNSALMHRLQKKVENFPENQFLWTKTLKQDNFDKFDRKFGDHLQKAHQEALKFFRQTPERNRLKTDILNLREIFPEQGILFKDLIKTLIWPRRKCLEKCDDGRWQKTIEM